MASRFDEIVKPSLLKIDRAKHHVNQLASCIDSYLAKNPFRLVIVGNAKTLEKAHSIEQQMPFPDEISLCLGDAVHNLRSALDILMFSMIGSRAKRPEGVQFPFAWKKDSLVSTMTNRETELAGKEVVAEIEAMEPYPGGSEWFHGLHALDITDKHKLIIPVGSSGTMTTLEFSVLFGGAVDANFPSTQIVMMQGTTLIQRYHGSRAQYTAQNGRFRAGKYESDKQPTFQICFGEGQPFDGRPIIPIMVALTGEVERATLKLAGIFIAHPPA